MSILQNAKSRATHFVVWSEQTQFILILLIDIEISKNQVEDIFPPADKSI